MAVWRGKMAENITAPQSFSSRMLSWGQTEIMLALAVLGILVLLFVPMPAWMMDMLFALNITISVVILLTVLFIQKSLEFTAFPMLLLITTIFRLALNVASTRLILSDGHQSSAAAGQIIATFGDVVMGGSFVIGLIIFLILIIVNFVVITRGSSRIAEVAARFTLDSLPGKQMAIDADLNAGIINEDQARERRTELEQETGFFGAMDGASKFVRGDAIAGLIITGLNIIVGLVIGTTMHDLSIGEAASRYTLLTVGDGLVAYIPALTISMAAGMLVAKSGTVGVAGAVVFNQISQNPVALYVAAGLLVLISLLPGMPLLPFWFLAGIVGGAGYMLTQQTAATAEADKQAEIEEQAQEALKATEEEPLSSVLRIDTLRLELGYSMLTLIDESKGGRLTEQIRAMRRQMARDIGFVVPSVRIQDNMQLEGGQYRILIKDIEAGAGSLEPGKYLAMDPSGTAPAIDGVDTVEPTFGLPAKWIESAKREEANFNGYTVVDTATVIVTHLTEIIKDNLSELLTRGELEKLLDELKPDHEKLIADLVPEKVQLGTLQKVLQNLLSERVSVRDLPTILEALSDAQGGSVMQLTEQVRQRLSRQICVQHQDPTGSIPLLALAGGWEEEFIQSLHSDGQGDPRLAMAPEKVQTFLKAVRDVYEKQVMSGVQPVLITSAKVRPYVRMLLSRALPNVPVLAQNEIYPKATIKTVGTI